MRKIFDKPEGKLVLGFSLYCVLVALVFSPQIDDCFNLPKFLIMLGGVIFFLCCLFFKFYNEKVLSFYKNPLYLPFFIFATWQIFTLFCAINKISGISELGLNIVCASLLFIVPLILRKPRDIILFARIIVVSSFFISVYGIFQHFGFDFINWSIKNSAISTLGRRNFAGEYLVFIIPWAMLCFLTARKYLKICFSMIILFLLFHLFLTFTRASWLGFAFSLLTMVFLLFRTRIKLAAVMKYVSVVMFLVLIANAYAGVFQFEPGTVKSRILIWKVSLSMIKSNPLFGCGVGNFETGYYAFSAGKPDTFLSLTQRITHAHNEFLEIAVETGIIGLFLFLFFISVIFRMVFSVLGSKNEKPFEKATAIFVFAGITGILVNSLASFPLQTTTGSFFFFLSCGILSSMYFVSLEKKPVEIKFHHAGIPFLCMVIACFYIAFAFTSFNSSYSLSKSKKIMRQAVRKGNPVLWLLAESYAKNAVDYNPFSVENYFQIGKIYLVGNQIEKARENFFKALRFQPYSDLILNNIGLVEQRDKHFLLAERYFLKAFSINQKNPETIRNLGNLYFEIKDYSRAVSYFLRCLALNPDDTGVLFDLGQIYFEKGQYQKAKQAWEKILKVSPDFHKVKEKISMIPSG